MLSIDARSSRELQAVILSLKGAEKAVQARIRAETRSVIAPAWQKAMTEHVDTRYEALLAATGRAKVSNQNITIQAAGVRGSKRADMRTIGHAVEYGSYRERRTTYTSHSRKGRAFKVTRHTARQFKPANRKGYVFWPTARVMVPRLTAMWVQTVVRGFYQSFEGRPF